MTKQHLTPIKAVGPWGTTSYSLGGIEVQGLIGMFKLDNWWNNEFTKEEQNTIENVFKPLGSSGELHGILTHGNIDFAKSKFDLLLVLLGWFRKPEYFQIAKKIIKLADTLIEYEKNILDIHLYFFHKIQCYYRSRDVYPEALDLAIQACLDQIKISPVVVLEFKKDIKLHGNHSADPNSEVGAEHTGFKQLCIIYAKQAKYQEVIQLSERAKSEGWVGDWDKRIERARKKLDVKRKE
jgi:hypothetical protein